MNFQIIFHRRFELCVKPLSAYWFLFGDEKLALSRGSRRGLPQLALDEPIDFYLYKASLFGEPVQIIYSSQF